MNNDDDDRRDDAGTDDEGWGEAAEVETGEVDSGEVDSGEVDSGEVDSGEVDSGELDSGEVDSGEVDSGELPSGEVDSGEVDHPATSEWPVAWPVGRPAEGSDAADASDAGQAQATPEEISDAEPSTDWGDDPTPPPEIDDVEHPRAPPGHIRQRGDGSLRKRLRLILAGALALVVVVGGVLSWLNSRHYYLECGAEAISAERGSFWPWGQAPLEGKRYRPIPIPPDATCTDRAFDDAGALEAAFLAALLQRATTLLTSGDPDAVDEAEVELSQALLLTRSASRSELRQQVERLEGDVEYWRAAAEVQAAMTALQDAAKRFDAAAKRGPQHNRDASAWAEHARRMETEIRRGPLATRKDAPPSADGKPHFAGTGDEDVSASSATPTTPAVPDADDDTAPEPSAATEATTATDAGPPPPAAPADAAPPPPDARLPRGGVLL